MGLRAGYYPDLAVLAAGFEGLRFGLIKNDSTKQSCTVGLRISYLGTWCGDDSGIGISVLASSPWNKNLAWLTTSSVCLSCLFVSGEWALSCGRKPSH